MGNPGGGGGIGAGGLGAAKVKFPNKTATNKINALARLNFIGRKSIKKNALSKFFTAYFGTIVKQTLLHKIGCAVSCKRKTIYFGIQYLKITRYSGLCIELFIG